MKKTTSTTGWPVFWSKDTSPPFWSRALARVYCAIIRVRRYAYQQGYCRTQSASCPLLVVGNRVVGGTGKTPCIIGLVKLLKARGVRVGIVSRGYGRNDKQLRFVQANSPVEQVGDEPLLLATSLDVPIVVASQRVLAVQSLLEAFPHLDLIISDDGWQHLAMAKDAVIEIIDDKKGYGNGYCLPAGPLREPVDASQADLIIRQGKEMHLVPSHWYHLATQTDYPITIPFSELPHSTAWQVDKGISALAGIGNPERFFTTLENLGINLSNKQALADHQAISLPLLQTISVHTPIIMTMKDAMRCPTETPDSCWALAVDTHFSPDIEQQLLTLLDRLGLAQQFTQPLIPTVNQ